MEIDITKSIESLHAKADKASIDNAIILERIGSVQDHLRKLNGSVARHDGEIESIKITNTQILGNISTLFADNHDRRVDDKRKSTFWTERIVWFLGLLVLGVLQLSGVLHLQ